MKDVAPTMQEIKDVLQLFETSSVQELQELGVFNDNRRMVIRENMTYVLMSQTNEENRETLWKYCKKIASFSHAPITLKEYQRMKTFSEDTNIVDVILLGLGENLYPFSDGKSRVEPVQGYYYAIATISQSLYRRDDIISLLQKIADYMKQNMPKDISVLKRNMDVLKKSYPDLESVTF